MLPSLSILYISLFLLFSYGLSLSLRLNDGERTVKFYNTDGTINSNRHTGHDRMEKTNYTQTRRMWYITFLLHMIVSLVRPHNSRVRHRIASVRWISATLLPTLILSHILMTPLQAQIALIGSLPAYDVTTHIGTPENSPPPGIEFLGAGYDLVHGNPLDEQGEAFLDPGFRLPAIELLFDVRRTAGSYQEPLGTSIKRGPACKYATLAQEVASVSAYQQLLALDVTTLDEFGMAMSMPLVPPIPSSSSSSSSSSSTGSSSSSSTGVTGTTGTTTAEETGHVVPNSDGFVIVEPAPLHESADAASTPQSMAHATATGMSGPGGKGIDGTGPIAPPGPDGTQSPTPPVPPGTPDSPDVNLAGRSSSTGDRLSSGSSSTAGSGTGMDRCPHKIGGPPPRSAPLSGAFMASFGFLSQQQNLEQKDQVAFYSRSLCVEYQVEFRSFIPPLLTENFSNGIAFLPDFVPNEADLSDRASDARTRFRAFIAEFGTHYLHRLIAGGKRVVTTYLSASSVASLRSQGVNLALGAAFMPGMESTMNTSNPNSTGPFSGTNFTLFTQQDAFQSMSAQIESRIETTIGGLPFINFYGWAATVPDRTTPIQYTLKPLYALLPTGEKRAALKTVLTAYINSAGKYPSIDNRATFGPLTQDFPPPTPIYNTSPRQPTVTLGAGSVTSTPPATPQVPLSQSEHTPQIPATTLSPVGPAFVPNRLPAGPGGQYPIARQPGSAAPVTPVPPRT